MKVKNMLSPRTGKKTGKNQFIITGQEQVNYPPEDLSDIDNDKIKVVYFQSYDSIIAKVEYHYHGKVVVLDSYYWDYSVTTSKYRNQFLGEDTKTIKDKIESGEYILADLNPKEEY